jgi:hypothetical protein
MVQKMREGPQVAKDQPSSPTLAHSTLLASYFLLVLVELDEDEEGASKC